MHVSNAERLEQVLGGLGGEGTRKVNEWLESMQLTLRTKFFQRLSKTSEKKIFHGKKFRSILPEIN